MVKRLYGLNPSDFDGCLLYYPQTNMEAEELLLLKLRDTSQQEAVRAAVEARLETRRPYPLSSFQQPLGSLRGIFFRFARNCGTRN